MLKVFTDSFQVTTIRSIYYTQILDTYMYMHVHAATCMCMYKAPLTALAADTVSDWSYSP